MQQLLDSNNFKTLRMNTQGLTSYLTAQQQREDDLREVEQQYQETLRQAEQDYQDLVREDIQTFEGQQATGAQGAQMDLERLRVLGGYANPQELKKHNLSYQEVD